MLRRRTGPLATAFAALVLSSGCGGSGSATPTSAATPVVPISNFFPDNDTPLSGAGDALTRVWSPYEVQTIPSRHVQDTVPQPPPLFNLSNGAVPDDMLQEWANGLMRAGAWRKWAAAHAQSGFLPHIDPEHPDVSQFSSGATETLPDCYVYPHSLALIPIPQDASGNATTQYSFVATFAGPCQATFNFADGHTQTADSWDTDKEVRLDGYDVDDPVLGNLWMITATNDCYSQCPAIPASPPPAASRVQRPDDDTPIGQASAQLQAVWSPYSVQLVPGRAVASTLPAVPKVDNGTAGVITDATAQTWAVGLMRDVAWQRWSWLNLQLNFQQHIGGSSLFNGPLASAATSGGKPTLPNCALVPTGLRLVTISATARSSAYHAASDEYEFIASYPSQCSATLTFPDGHTQSLDLAQTTVDIFGSLRPDPLLGDLWYPDVAIVDQG